MNRRRFITLVGGAAAAWPLAARAQQPAVPVIGFLLNGAPGGPLANRLHVFRQGLAETGIVEGRDATSEYRWAEQHPERLPGLAADLVRREVKVIVTLGSTPAALAAKAATAIIPIVFSVGSDPVELGLVASLNRPGSNITGVTGLGVEVGPKRLEIMHELIPAATAFAVVVNPATLLAKIEAQDLQRAAGNLGLQLHVLEASSETDFEAVFAAVTQLKAAGLLISTDPLFTRRTDRIAALALRSGIPAVSSNPEFVAASGLVSYGSSLDDEFRLAGVYTGRIVKGEKPSDMPVQEATRIELGINLKTAKALGITVPITLLSRADEVIE